MLAPLPAPSPRAFYLQHTDLGILATGTILTLAALSEENSERATTTLESMGPLDVPIDIGDSFGSTWTMLGVTAGLGAVGWLGGGPRFSNAAIDMGKTLLVTGAIVGGLKVTINRTRPNNAGHSFPSGHTAVAFAGASVLDEHFGWKVGVPAYGLATFTGLGRMEDNKHYLSDVIAGATIGLLVGRAIPSRYRDNLSAFGGPDRIGVSVRF
ncbi:MAG: phosphatase PAP2 family protein [Thermoleophilia bacterium]|nr:phosphatase PAP2 family protein [Thermoleophilia bacterium]